VAPAPGRADTPFGPCPTSYLSCANPPGSTLPRRSATCPSGQGSGIGSGSYDLPAGTLTASAQGLGAYTGAADVATDAEFQVTGLADAPPLVFTARLHVIADARASSSAASGSVAVLLREGASNETSMSADAGAGAPLQVHVEPDLTVTVHP